MSSKVIIVLEFILLGFTLQVRAEIPESAFLFNRRCALCHNSAALTPRIRSIPDDKRRAFLENFLIRHHTRDAEERKLIIDYLLFQPR